MKKTNKNYKDKKKRNKDMENPGALSKELYETIVTIVDERMRNVTVTRIEFEELKAVVKELAEAQKKTEQRIGELTQRMDQLTQRMDQLTQRVDQLTQRMDQLTQQVNELAKGLNELAKEHKKTREQVGGLSAAVGFSLEDKAFVSLPKLLRRDFGVTIEGRLKRKYVNVNGEFVEVNIIGEGEKEGESITIIGESKSQLSKNGVDGFIRKLGKLDKVFKNILAVMVTYMISEYDVEEYAKSKGIVIYYSYNFDEV